ncbi:MAG: ABC transporter permease [Isosphaeraceae bacterium]|nr:ABC transporter permease [Isosphaeraceae bacterium]
MSWIALKMLVGDRAKFLGIVLGLTFAALLITQQGSIFCGLMLRTCGQITDITGADLWVMDPNVRFIDDVKPMIENNLYRVRGVEGVLWAVPLYKGQARAKLNTVDREGKRLNVIEQVILLGLDDATLVGAPPLDKILVGELTRLRQPDAIIIDNNRLMKLYPGERWGELETQGNAFYTRFLNRELEMNDHRAIIVGVCEATRTFQSNPVVYTLYSRAKYFAPQERKILSYILAKTEPGVDPAAVAQRIKQTTGLGAASSAEFTWKTIDYYMKFTGIPINFGITAMLGFLVGTAIAGQTFYNFTLENLKQFGALKAMGATNLRIVQMILLQALVVGLLGYGIGVGLAASFGWANQSPPSDLGFFCRREVLAAVGGLVTLYALLYVGRVIQRAVFLQATAVTLLGYGLAFAAAFRYMLQGVKGTELAFYCWWPVPLVTGVAVVFICILSSLVSIRRVVVLEPAVVFRG